MRRDNGLLGLGFWSIGFVFCLVSAKIAYSDDAFEQKIRPLLSDYCLTCHSTAAREGELDLERFATWESVKQQPDVWEQVLHQVELGEMPPATADSLSAMQRAELLGWVRETLNRIALENAGDPGPVVLRRLSNHEYTYTLQDLTGIESLQPAREFPVDGAAGEGFTNVGDALVMSPALLTKYLDAAKEISQQAVFLPHGFRFSPSNSPQDWTAEALDRLRQFYARYTTHAGGDQVTLQGIGLDMGTGEGRLPLGDYLDAIQGRRSSEELSPKYLERLRRVLASADPSPLLDPLRAQFREGQLAPQAIESWQQVLWKFELVGHVGRPGGPQGWQVGTDPLVGQQEFRIPLEGRAGQGVYLSAWPVGGVDAPAATADRVLWENGRLVAKGRPDLPISQLLELEQFLIARRQSILDHVEASLAALAVEMGHADPSTQEAENPNTDLDLSLVTAWRDYLGLNSLSLEPLLPNRIERHPDYAFIQGWTAGDDLSVMANASDVGVRTPGLMAARSVAVHPSPSREVVIAWQSPVSAAVELSGRVADAHPECGNGVTWRLEIRRGGTTQVLAQGVTEGAREIPFGPFQDVPMQIGQAIVLAIGPREGNHFCDLTAVDLTVSDGAETWNLSADLAPQITKSNPLGPWHLLSQSVSPSGSRDLPPVMAQWRDAPSPSTAAAIRAHLEQEFPLTHPLLATALRTFQSAGPAEVLSHRPGEVIALEIPAVFSEGAELVVTGRLAAGSTGSVQLAVATEPPPAIAPGLSPHRPIVIGSDSSIREFWQAAFAEFRSLFPVALCYSRIVPVDEVVTLWMYYREDHHLRELMLEEEEIETLERLWEELLYVSQAPVRQVDAFEQIYQFATQDRPDLVVEFEKMREPIQRAAETFQSEEPRREAEQKRALLEFAARAWRRLLSDAEQTRLQEFAPRLMLARILASPRFLYRGEQATAEPRAVDDWELATRLSYFLWSSLPDDELRELANAGRLRDPVVLEQQTRRMLQDARVRRLATEFGCQFLHVRDVATLDEKSERHFPTFVDLRADMQEEVTRFLIDLMQNDGRVLSLLDADHSFLNPGLAQHYGIPIVGDGWRRVDGMQAHGRGGLLGFAATLAKHSGASRTSAILRGMWVSEVVLGEKTPNPPPGVPTLPEEAPQELTERQLIERHSSDPQCANCHRRIDPYGFALEGFDAIGRLRTADTQTVLYDGTAVDGMADLRDYLSTRRREVFLRQFSRKLLGYALGRSVQLSDQPLLDTMVAAPDPTFAQLVHQIVTSHQFRHIRGHGGADE